MAKLELEVSTELVNDLKRLAQAQYGNDGRASLGNVVEAAIEMRLLWDSLVDEPKGEAEEPVSNWEFPEAPDDEALPEGVSNWIFDRSERE